MKRPIKITIPKPCEKQEWSSEFISNREQLCLLCSKKGFDATNLSEVNYIIWLTKMNDQNA